MLLDTPPTAAAATKGPYPDPVIKRRIEACPKLGSLQSINRALNELLASEKSLTSQIAEIIRRDPSLAARLLRLVNSVYFGLSTRINNIEEAVFFLGLRQIRELALATPVIEDLEKLQASNRSALPWKELWGHSIATAILTRDILATTAFQIDDDTDYLIGLLHNVGKVVMANAFPEELQVLMTMTAQTPQEYAEHERALIGWDHAQIGAYYLERHQIAKEISIAVRFHNAPAEAPEHSLFAAAVQVADSLVRFAGVSSGFEAVDPVANESWLSLDGWNILYGADPTEAKLARAGLANSLNRLPSVLQGIL